MQETWVRSLGQEDPLEKEMATYSSIIFWKIPWTEETGRLQTKRVGSKEWDTTERTHTHIYMYIFLFFFIFFSITGLLLDIDYSSQ